MNLILKFTLFLLLFSYEPECAERGRDSVIKKASKVTNTKFKYNSTKKLYYIKFDYKEKSYKIFVSQTVEMRVLEGEEMVEWFECRVDSVISLYMGMVNKKTMKKKDLLGLTNRVIELATDIGW